MDPVPDHGEDSYRGSQRLEGKKTLITGGDSGIGRAVAIAFAREGVDVAISYLSEEEDAADVKKVIEAAGRKCLGHPELQRWAGSVAGQERHPGQHGCARARMDAVGAGKPARAERRRIRQGKR